MENNLKFLLNKYGFSFKKAFGQNFLSDENLLEEIVESAGITKEDTVLEIGCGAGALTTVLAGKAKRVVGYEIDFKLKPLLNDLLTSYNNTEIVFKDIMKENLKELENNLGNDYILVANLPYYITTPIVLEFLEKAKKIKRMVVMVQEEVADRFTAKENCTDYGAITVAINLRGSAEKILRVPREKFTPVPNVDSAVVKIDIDRKKLKNIDLNAVRNTVRASFSGRRKMLANNLIRSFNISRESAEGALLQTGVSTTCRAENLTAQNFITLTDCLKKIGVKL